MERVVDSFVASSDQSAISEFTRLSQERLACSYVSLSSPCRFVAAFGLAFITEASVRSMMDRSIRTDHQRTVKPHSACCATSRF